MKFLITIILLTVIVGEIFCGQYFTSNGTTYYFSAPLKKNWYQAQRFCHANGMHLATIHTDHEYQILLEVIFGKFHPADSDHFWTSGTDMGHTDMEFYWVESGQAVIFSNWIDGSPVKNHKGCILLHGGSHRYKFHDGVCENSYYFICQDRWFMPSKQIMYFNSSFFDG